MRTNYRQIFADGIWRQNTGLVVLLGLCPLLAVTNTVVNGLGLGLATILTLIFSNLAVSLARGLLRPEIRIPAYVLIIASVVTVIQLLMQAWLYDLYRVLGIFIPADRDQLRHYRQSRSLRLTQRSPALHGGRTRYRPWVLPGPGRPGRTQGGHRARNTDEPGRADVRRPGCIAEVNHHPRSSRFPSGDTSTGSIYQPWLIDRWKELDRCPPRSAANLRWTNHDKSSRHP